MSNIQELIPFNNACEEFISGKYLLVDIKIASILNIIDQDEKIKNIISTSCEEHSFSQLFATYVINDENMVKFSMPENEKAIICFVYNLLVKFKNNQINFYDFLTKYFENNDLDFKTFANMVIIPFKNSINSIYSKRHVLVETNDYQNNIYNKIISTIKLIVSNIDSFKLKMNEKEEFTMLLNSLFLASEKNDKKLVFSLMIGLDYFSKCNKKTRTAYLSLEECFG